MNKPFLSSGALLLGGLLLVGCDAMTDYPQHKPYTSSGDEMKSGPGYYGGTNVADNGSASSAMNQNGSGNSPGTGSAAGAGSTSNSSSNTTGASSSTAGPGLSGTASYGGSSVGGGTSGQTTNNGTSGPPAPGSR